MAWGGTCGRCFIIIPVELCQRKKQPPVAHNAEREMTNMQPNTMQPAGLGRTNGFSARLAELKSFFLLLLLSTEFITATAKAKNRTLFTHE